MITDYLKNLHLYQDLQEYEEMILKFIERVQKEDLPVGRYDLEKGVFASYQSYNTKPRKGAQMESHKEYCDLQYIVSGTEKICWSCLEKLTVKEDMTPGADSIVYEPSGDQGYTVLEPGMFGFYAPQDGHMPGIAPDDQPAPVSKIVFKIPVKGA